MLMLMKHIVRPAVLIVAAMVGSAVVLVALIGAAKSLSVFASTPADFLPASETTLIAYQPTDSMQKRWQLQSDEAVALLELESGTKGFVEFTADPTAATKRIGIFGVNVSDPLLAPSVATQANPLDKEDAYRRIENIVPKKTSWAYLSTALLHEPQAIGQRILRPALLRKASRIGYSEDTNDVHIYRLETNRPWRTTALTIPEVRNAFFVMSYGNASQAWDSVKTVLQKNDAAVLEGLLRSYAGKFGAVSFDHEILPLMEQPGSLQFTQTGGSVHVLLSGTHEDKTELNTIIEHLHASYAVTLPTTRVTHRVLDQRFSSTDLRHDESVIVQSDKISATSGYRKLVTQISKTASLPPCRRMPSLLPPISRSSSMPSVTSHQSRPMSVLAPGQSRSHWTLYRLQMPYNLLWSLKAAF